MPIPTFHLAQAAGGAGAGSDAAAMANPVAFV